MAVLSIGQVWGDTANFSQSDLSGQGTSGSGSAFTGATDGDITMGGVGYGANGHVKIYANGTLTFTPSNGATITGITLTAVSNYEKTWSASPGSVTVNTSSHTINWTGSSTSVVTLTNTATAQARITAMSVTYTAGSTPQPTVSSDPTSWDFGAVATDAAASKVFSVSGSDLEAGTLTLTAPSGYSVSPASISVASAGGLDATNVTVSKNTSAAGTYNGNLTISGCGLESAVNVALSMEVKAKHTVTWDINGSTSTSQVIDGAKPVFPATPAACDAASTTFIGWATAPWTGKLANLDDKTVYTKAADMPAVTAAVTYYAVFAKSSGSAGNLFEWEGGTSSALTAPENNVTAYGLGSDYAESNAPYRVKFDTEGDYIVITTSGAIESVAVGVKMLGGGNTSHIYVQEAEDAESDFSAVETLTISGAQNDVLDLETENAFKTDSRAVKLLFNKGSNVGVGPITIVGAVSMSDYMTTCCTKYAVNIAAGIEHGSISADPASACEGATVTLTFTPATNYHLSAWTLNGVAQDIAENTFEMPNEAVTVSATFAQDACDPLATPVVAVSGKAYPYNAVKLAWTAIEHADSYKVYIYDNEDNELEHNDAFAGVEYTIGHTLSASTTYKYSVQAISNTPATFCPSTEAESTFKTDALPTAHLTLIDLEGEHDDSGDYAILTPFNLPSTAATCAKTFMGWDPDDECATAPTYAKGAEFTFANTTGVTLYAVYADGGPTNGTITKTMSEIVSENNYTVSSGNDVTMYTELALNSDITLSTTGSANCGSFWGTSPNNDWRLYQNKSGNAIVTAASGCTLTSVKFTFGNSNTGALFDGENQMTSGTAVSASGSSVTYTVGNSSSATNGQIRITAVEVKYTKAGSYSNYSTTCVEAPEATPASASIEVAAAGGNGTLNVMYENVNLANVAVALYNNAACTEDFNGGWLTASIAGDDKHIAYTAQENTSYAARTAYIKLTAPETSAAADPAVVVIPVTQAKCIPVFANLAALVEANLSSGTDVTVSFANEVITDDQTISGPKRAGVFLTTTAGSNAIEIFYNKGTTVVPAGWAIGGSLSATAKTFTWTLFNSQWELIPLGNDWTWDNGDLVYTAPKEVSSVVITGAPSKTTYVDGELFKPAGLTVTVNYTVGDPEVNPVGVTFECTPARVAKSDDPVSVSVIATFNEVPSEAFPVNVTVGDIQKKTVEEFIAAGNADMRCYLEGIVSDIETGAKLKYGNFNLTDASGTIYVYGCLTSEGVAEKFDELGVANGDKIKVIAEDYDYYNTKHEAKNVQFVSKKSPATMTFNPMALEFGDVETMAPATITLADASDIVYSIKEGSDDCVTISDDQITAKSVAGTATIVATLAETPEYVGATVEFVVTVTAPITKYAISFDDNGADGGEAPEDIANQAENAEVTLPANAWTKEGYKFDGWKVINNTTSAEVPVAEGKFAMPASAVTIQAQWAEIPSWAYVYDNNVEVVHGGTSGVDNGTITISETAYKLVKAGSKSNTGTIVVTVPAGATDLHFHAFAWGGKTAKIQIAGVDNPSISMFDLAGEAGAEGSGNDFTLAGVPVDQYFHVSFDAVAEETEITFSKAEGSADNRFFFYGVNQVGGNFGSYHRNVTSGNYGTICLPYAGTISGATLFEIAGFDGSMILCDEITDGKMKAGRPYIFKAAASQLTVDYTANIKTAAGSHNGLYGFYNLENMATDDADQKALTQDDGNYILYSNAYWLVSERDAFIYNFRAYIKLGEIENAGEPAPGRRRVAMAVHGEQVVTDIDAINASEKPMKLMIDGQLFILRGEKMFDATGRLVK